MFSFKLVTIRIKLVIILQRIFLLLLPEFIIANFVSFTYQKNLISD